ncbi:MAG: hypothetical protein V1744_04830 [Candidatus Altiarchaeota archaeon]
MDFLTRSSRKGQIPIENLILYAGIIIVVLVGLVVVWQEGIFTPLLGKRGSVGFSQIVPMDWFVGQDSGQYKVYFTLKNEGDAPAEVKPESINLRVGRVQCNPAPATGKNLQPAEKWILELDCPDLQSEYKLGEYYEADMDVDYTNEATKTNHTSVGKIYGLIEVATDMSPFLPTTTATTETTIPECFKKECNKVGDTDEYSCEDIIFVYNNKQEPCTYCPLEGDPYDLDENGEPKRKCKFNGKCGTGCNPNEPDDCDYEDKYLDYLNLCSACLEDSITPGVYKCKEKKKDDKTKCGPCNNLGKDPTCVNKECDWCYKTWQYRDYNGTDHYAYLCKEKENCGKNCIFSSFDRYLECMRTDSDHPCPHCDTDGKCVQGDCEKSCELDSDCMLGCAWCNSTTKRCDMGDCGKPCDQGESDCELGCKACFSGRCVKTDIGVTLNVNNGTADGWVVSEENGLIHLDASANSLGGVGRLWVTSNITVADAGDDPGQACKLVADERNSGPPITDPTGASDPATKAWLNKYWGESEPWPEKYMYDCEGREYCETPDTDDWRDTQSEVGQYCYFAIAQQYSTTSDGMWSYITSDYIQVGYLNVYLISPKPLP